MNVKEVIKIIEPIFKDILRDEKLKINKDSNAYNIDGWDSLNHILLVVGIEEKMKVRFTSGEISTYNNVGEMCEAIVEKLS